MALCQLTEAQKNMLRSIVPGLAEGSVKTEWIVTYGGDSITGIFGLSDDGSLWRNHWKGVTHADFDDFIECGLFRQTRKDSLGVPTNFTLHKQRIIELVETNFGESAPETNTEGDKMAVKDPRKVFVVHGRNEKIRRSMFSFLRSIGLEPMEWSHAVADTGKGTPYTGEVIERGISETTQAIVVLLTPDDIAYLHPSLQSSEERLQGIQPILQPRPNVFFEAGMAMGHMSERTIVLEFGKVHAFSDIFGRNTIRFKDDAASREQLVQRLEGVGCKIRRGTDWLTEGDFALDLRVEPDRNHLDSNWGKSGDVWWLLGDLIAAWNWINQGSKYNIDNGLKRCHFHAAKLGMTDKDIVERLKQMMDEAKKYTENDWTKAKREEFLLRIDSIRDDAGQVAQNKQLDFKADPD